MVEIFSYTNYRLFLKDLYEERKKANPHFSYRYIAQKVGFKSAGFFTQIVKGQTNVSNHVLASFCKFFKMKRREIEYFELLVHFDQAKTQEEKRHFFERIINFKEVKAKILTPDQYEFYQKWYYAVIRDILSIYEFRGDYRELANNIMPSITTAEAEKAIKLLLKLGMVRRNEKGVFEVTDSFIKSQAEEYSIVLSGYAVQMMERAKEAVNVLPKDERLISWVGFSVSDETYQQIREEIRVFRKHILTLVEKDKHPCRVYHFNTQFFPVSKKITTKGERERV